MIVVCAGTRPNFIKAAPVINELRRVKADYELVKIGQHNDRNMSTAFFDEFNLGPCVTVNMSGDNHAYQTASAMIAFEQYLRRADAVMVFGDCNASLAPALVAAKRGVPIAHIEAGVRGYNKALPEEVNRILIDSISDYLFAPSAEAYVVAKALPGKAYLVGDVMYDLVTETELHTLDEVYQGLKKGEYYFCTLHRAYNVDDRGRLRALMEAIGMLDAPVVIPVHPRLEKRILEFGIKIPGNVVALEPVTYRESLTLQKNAKKVITDSGGVQKEAFYLGVPCSVLRSETEWGEINCLVPDREPEKIVGGILREVPVPDHNPYYHGGASKQIVKALT